MGKTKTSQSSDPFGKQKGELFNQLLPFLQSGIMQQGPQLTSGATAGPTSTMDAIGPTLLQAVNTGLPTNVTDLGRAETQRGQELLFRDVFPQIREQFGQGGNRFSTDAQAGEQKTAGDLMSQLLMQSLNRGVDTQEAATQRRLQTAFQLPGVVQQAQAPSQLIQMLLQLIGGTSPTTKQFQPAFAQIDPIGAATAAIGQFTPSPKK